MNWQEIKVSADNTHFLFEGKQVFGKKFFEVLKFHSPGLAPVKDKSGSYHIDLSGKELYTERYTRSFGFYCNHAAVENENMWFHLTVEGKKAYDMQFSWVGNFQERICPVRDKDNHYYHINFEGRRIYSSNYIYCGDFKDGIACVKQENGLFRHIDTNGEFIHHKEYIDMSVYHKNFATVKDEKGWFHIDKSGNEVYPDRYLFVEPFYNGFSVATKFNNEKVIINEKGDTLLKI